MNFTLEQAQAHQRRTNLHSPGLDPLAVGGIATVTDVDRAAAVRVDDRAERGLQARIIAYLTEHRAKGVVRFVVNPPMNRKSQLPEGAPDITFAYRGRPMAQEIKLPGKEPEPHQLTCHEAIRADGWLVAVVHSIEEAAAQLDAVDAAIEAARPQGWKNW